MNKISDWLNNHEREYAEGVKLHLEYGRNKQLQAYFEANKDAKMGDNAGSILKTELARILRIQQQNLPKEAVAEVSKELKDFKDFKEKKMSIVDNPFVDISKLPEELQKKYVVIKENYEEMHKSHENLEKVATDAQRATIVAYLKEKEDENAELWYEIDEWAKANGAEKSPTEEQKKDPVYIGMEIERERRNLKMYIARKSKRLADETDPEKIEDIQARILKWETRLAELKDEK